MIKIESFLNSILHLESVRLDGCNNHGADINIILVNEDERRHALAVLEEDRRFLNVSCKDIYINFDITDEFINSYEGYEKRQRGLHFTDSVGKEKTVYFEYFSPNLNTDLNLGVMRNIFLGKSVQRMMRLVYPNLTTTTLICDVGKLADIMRYYMNNHRDSENYKDLYYQYLNEIEGCITEENELQLNRSISNYSNTISMAEVRAFTEKYRSWIVKRLKSVHVQFDEYRYQSGYALFDQLGDYADRDIRYLNEIHKEGFDTIILLIGQDQVEHFNVVKNCLDDGVHLELIQHGFVSEIDKRETIFDFLQMLDNKVNEPVETILAAVQLLYLSYRPAINFTIDDRCLERIREYVEIIKKLQRLYCQDQPDASMNNKSLRSKAFVNYVEFSKEINNSINLMRPDLLIKAVSKFFQRNDESVLADQSLREHIKEYIIHVTYYLGIEYIINNGRNV